MKMQGHGALLGVVCALVVLSHWLTIQKDNLGVVRQSNSYVSVSQQTGNQKEANEKKPSLITNSRILANTDDQIIVQLFQT